MDFLIEHKTELEPRLASAILSLFDTSLDLVFYDLTSCYFEIDEQDRDRKDCSRRGVSTLRNYGYDRDRSGCPQVVLGVVMSKDGIPLCHHVFAGETADVAYAATEVVTVDIGQAQRLYDPETTGLGHRRYQLRVGAGIHGTADQRNLDTQASGKFGLHAIQFSDTSPTLVYRLT